MTTTIKSPKSKRSGKAEKEFAAALALPPEAMRLVQQARHRGGAAIDSWVIHCQFLQRTVLRTREVPREPADARLRADTLYVRCGTHARMCVPVFPFGRRPLLAHTRRVISLLIGIIGQVLRKPAELGLMSLDATARRHAAALKLPHDLDLTAAANVRADVLIRGAAAEARAAAERAAAAGGIKGVKEAKASPMPPNQVCDRRTDGDGRAPVSRMMCVCVSVCQRASRIGMVCRRGRVTWVPRFATNARRESSQPPPTRSLLRTPRETTTQSPTPLSPSISHPFLRYSRTAWLPRSCSRR